MRKFICAVVAMLAASCGSDADITSPTVVPAGANDAAWASIGKTCTPESPVYSVPRFRLDSAPADTHGPGRTVDDDWADLARTTPGGFAGLILENNAPVVFLVDTTQKQQALAALQAKNFFPNVTSARVRAARWNFAQLAEWYRYFQLNVFANPGLAFADIDEAKNRIAFGVRDAASKSAVEQTLSKLDVPCYLVAVGVAGVFTTDGR